MCRWPRSLQVVVRHRHRLVPPGRLPRHLGRNVRRRVDLAAVATVYGTSTHQFAIGRVLNRPGVADRLRAVLGETLFDGCVAAGAAMEPADAVRYARQQIQIPREIGDVS